MPVIGHTLVGIVVAQQFGPGTAASERERGRWTGALWLPAILALSYLPDVLTQFGVWLQLPSAQAAGHSLPVGCLLGVVLGALWSRLAATPLLRTVALATGVILLHDALDLFQDAERMPLWPFSIREVGVDWLMFDNRLAGEAVVFGLPFAVYQAWRVVTGRPILGAGSVPAVARWSAGLVVCGVLATTVGVIQLRQDRGAQMHRAEELLRAGRLDEALAAIDAGERWPASPGDGDLLRGRIYARMGDDVRAEEVFLRAYRNDPDEFWPTAVLANFYASRGPAEARRARSAPYVETLRARFAGHEAFPRVMGWVEQGLASGQ